jgi:hypothetical protein
VAVPRRHLAWALGVLDFVAARCLRRHSVFVGKAVEHGGAVDYAGGHQVDHAFGAFLDLAFYQHQPRGHDRAALLFEIA